LLPLVLLVLLAGLVALVLGCKQGEGERCQVNADCDDGLICNQATNPPRCQQPSSSGGIDATVPDIFPDAPPDAPDAMPDA
jgi:hypothetical protein